jgi:hypothetical protein
MIPTPVKHIERDSVVARAVRERPDHSRSFVDKETP